MFDFNFSTISIGLERLPEGIKCAAVETSRKGLNLKNLFLLNPGTDNVKPLYTHHPILTTCLNGTDVLARTLILPITKNKDIAAALTFQAEPLLPYPIDEAILSYQIINKNTDSTTLTLFAAKKEAVKNHLESWKSINIEPEVVSAPQAALTSFVKNFISDEQTCLIIHLQKQNTIAALVSKGKLVASFGQQEGLEPLLDNLKKEKSSSAQKNLNDWKQLSEKGNEQSEALKKLQQLVTKIGFALAKELRNETIEGIVITGEAVNYKGLDHFLTQNLNTPLKNAQPTDHFTIEQLHAFALPIGLAIQSLPTNISPTNIFSTNQSIIDFQKDELSYPHPWRRLKLPVAIYFGLIGLLTLTFYFFSQHYLHYEEDMIKQSYVDLLASTGKSPQQFEDTFDEKNPQAKEKFNGEIPTLTQLSADDLRDRLAFLQKDLKATPDSYPLFANIPRVSDVLAWLSQHHAIVVPDEQGIPQTRLQIEDFNYTMVKRPQQGKKQEKYQVYIELELSSPTPKWAREFHDALIEPNDWVDNKNEVKWNANRGKYKTSFYLKDKTVYPSR
jgi:type IV pilus assembly protein PilM